MAGMATTFFLYAYTAVVSPGLLFTVLLPLVWVGLLLLAAAWFTRHPLRVLLLPLVAAGVWLWASLA
jgi:hypothetical protein